MIIVILIILLRVISVNKVQSGEKPTKSSNFDVVKEIDLPASTTASWSRDGKFLSILSDGAATVTVWSTDTWKMISKFHRTGGDQTRCLFFSNDNNIITALAPNSSDEQKYYLALWDKDDGHLIRKIEKPIINGAYDKLQTGDCDLSRDAKLFAVSSVSGSGITIYSTDDWRVLKYEEMLDPPMQRSVVKSIRFFHSSNKIAVMTFGELFIINLDKSEKISPILRNKYDATPFSHLSIKEDDSKIAIGLNYHMWPGKAGPSVIIFDINENELSTEFATGLSGVTAIRWCCRDSAIIIGGVEKRAVKLVGEHGELYDGDILPRERQVTSISSSGELIAVTTTSRVIILMKRN